MKAFILAAGVSRRLYPHTYNTPKCLLKVGNKPIIDYQMEAIKSLGITEISIVVGYHREMLIEYLRDNFPSLNYNFIVNHHYFETNTAFSLHTGKEFLNDDLILMNADVVYPKGLLRKLINSPN